jgi:hypothetical protein
MGSTRNEDDLGTDVTRSEVGRKATVAGALAMASLAGSPAAKKSFAGQDRLLARPPLAIANAALATAREALASPIDLGPPSLPLAAYVAAEASWYRSQATPGADLIAEHLDSLVRGIRATSANDPETYRVRIETLNRDAEFDEWERAEQQGYLRGLREGGWPC